MSNTMYYPVCMKCHTKHSPDFVCKPYPSTDKQLGKEEMCVCGHSKWAHRNFTPYCDHFDDCDCQEYRPAPAEKQCTCPGNTIPISEWACNITCPKHGQPEERCVDPEEEICKGDILETRHGSRWPTEGYIGQTPNWARKFDSNIANFYRPLAPEAAQTPKCTCGNTSDMAPDNCPLHGTSEPRSEETGRYHSFRDWWMAIFRDPEKSLNKTFAECGWNAAMNQNGRKHEILPNREDEGYPAIVHDYHLLVHDYRALSAQAEREKERGDRLEGMVDRLAGKNVDLYAQAEAMAKALKEIESASSGFTDEDKIGVGLFLAISHGSDALAAYHALEDPPTAPISGQSG